ncbi:hypothetical protein CPB83DRAFT_771916 [Crepidotus variabilis]|uniref:Rad60/SUMO-like domain-containing protein n=1 Tax=Crepidotus variabilis TaxID=179855 RepID=A0A9P6JLV4_9AGAR|nr:hypothetical protein CPB83DRAFT_771916 [Crepidotus variabilis]
MPPRPRPRPIPKATTSTSNVVAGSSSQAGSSNATSASPTEQAVSKFRDIVVNDTDEMFMKNRNRSSKTWQKLEKINKGIAVVLTCCFGGQDEKDLTPRRRKRQKKDASVVPSWQKNSDFKRMLSVDLSDSSDDDIQIIGDSSTPRGNHKGKRKRPRSRSRSITPPPALPEHQLQNAKNVVRQALRGAVRPLSPTLDLDESSDNIELGPEFTMLAERIRKEGRNRGSSQAPEGVEGDEVLITVKWVPHPLNPNGESEEWQYKVNRTDNFRDLFDAVADDAGVNAINLILTYQGKRFFSSITCQTLSIWSDSALFSAYEKTAFEHIQKNQRISYSQPPAGLSQTRAVVQSNTDGPIELDSDDDDAGYQKNHASPPIETQTQTQESDADSEAEQGDKIRIILRSAVTGNKDFTLIVKPTNKCGSIIKTFIKKAGLAAEYPHLFGGKGGGKTKKDPRLCIDGEKCDNDTEIAEMDLEEGDKVDVVGL